LRVPFKIEGGIL